MVECLSLYEKNAKISLLGLLSVEIIQYEYSEP